MNGSTIVLTGGAYGSEFSVVEYSNLEEGQVKRSMDLIICWYSNVEIRILEVTGTDLELLSPRCWKYFLQVSTRELPQLETGRWEHACGYYNIGDQMVLYIINNDKWINDIYNLFDHLGQWIKIYYFIFIRSLRDLLEIVSDADCVWGVQWSSNPGVNWSNKKKH